jgi:hypothetical protein
VRGENGDEPPKKYSMSCFSHMALCFLIATVTLRNSMADEQSWLAAGEWTIEKHNSMGSYGVGVSPKGCGDSPDNDPLSIFVQDFEGTLSSVPGKARRRRLRSTPPSRKWCPSTSIASTAGTPRGSSCPSTTNSCSRARYLYTIFNIHLQ